MTPLPTLFGFPVTLALELEPGKVIVASDALELKPDNTITVDPTRVLTIVNVEHAGTVATSPPRRFNLALDDDEAHDVHHALSVVCQLLDEVQPGEGAALTRDALPRLTRVARRLAHERRWKGTRPNPNV